MNDNINNPSHYGGKDNIYEVIKIAEHYNADLYIFNLLKYCLRAGVKNKATELEDLKKGAWYLQRKIDRLEAQKQGIEINLSCEDKLSPVIEGHKAEIKDVVNSWKSDQPKVIEDLKVGDKIKAIKIVPYEPKKANSLIIGKEYRIVNISNSGIAIKSETINEHFFGKKVIDNYFHVIHKQEGVLIKESIQEVKDSNYQEGLNENYY